MDAKVKTIQPRGHGFTQMGPRTVAWRSSVGLASEAALQGGDPYGLASEAALHEWRPLRPRKRGSAPRVATPTASQARQRSTSGSYALRVKPSGVQGSEPTPWWTKKRPVGSYFSLMFFRRA
jgi:hypothetical protein